MEKITQFLGKNKKALLLLAAGLVLILAAVIAVILLWPFGADGQSRQEGAAQKTTSEGIKLLEEKGLLAGVRDYTVKKGEVLDWDALVSWDGSVVKSVEVDDSRVEYAAEGDYEITFTIAFDEEALNRFLEENDAAFAADGGSAVVTATVTVTGEDADREETGSSGSEPAASDQEEPSQPGENSQPGSAASEPEDQTPSGAGSGQTGTSGQAPSVPDGSGGGTDAGAGTHEHVWVDHEIWVTVEDEPARTEKVTEYRLYWWDTKTWQTTEDSSVFADWQRKKMEWLRTYRYENNMPPELFLGYDENGNPTYQNDHAIVTYNKTIPAVTHEEKQVDYQYCSICGQRK